MNHLFTRIPQLEQKFVSFCNFSPQLVQYNELLLFMEKYETNNK